MKKLTFTKNMTLAVLVIVGGFINLHTSATTQSSRTPSSPRTNERQARDSGEQNANGCTTRYDRFRERNTITIEPRTMLRAGSDELKLGASAVVEGNNAAPREIDLHFDSTTNRLRYGNNAEVRFIIDGERIDGGVAYRSGGYAMRQVNEQLRLSMPAARFLEIINGREVEMQIGETEVTLRREDLQRLRDFAVCVRLRAEQR